MLFPQAGKAGLSGVKQLAHYHISVKCQKRDVNQDPNSIKIYHV